MDFSIERVIVKSPRFKRYQPVGLRIWHWLNAAIILALLATVGLRRTVFNSRRIAALISSKAEETGTQISPVLAKEMGSMIRNTMWDWHYLFGYALAGLLVLRILVAIIYKDFPIRAAWIGVRTCAECPVDERHEAIHYALVKSGYVAFYIITTIMVITGLAMKFSTTLGIEKSTKGFLHEVHELLMWFFVAFVFIHVFGVILGELTRYRGIISDMIHGGTKNESITLTPPIQKKK
jgi:cytochrome b561